mmetsp:Transcript_7488/g.19455  ORF Transcript_7488/g.19455 Transcript_7488/m.19455 type:complete len:345 (+) Transcript_7488:1557-2591(+)
MDTTSARFGSKASISVPLQVRSSPRYSAARCAIVNSRPSNSTSSCATPAALARTDASVSVMRMLIVCASGGAAQKRSAPSARTTSGKLAAARSRTAAFACRASCTNTACAKARSNCLSTAAAAAGNTMPPTLSPADTGSTSAASVSASFPNPAVTRCNSSASSAARRKLSPAIATVVSTIARSGGQTCARRRVASLSQKWYVSTAASKAAARTKGCSSLSNSSNSGSSRCLATAAPTPRAMGGTCAAIAARTLPSVSWQSAIACSRKVEATKLGESATVAIFPKSSAAVIRRSAFSDGSEKARASSSTEAVSCFFGTNRWPTSSSSTRTHGLESVPVALTRSKT